MEVGQLQVILGPMFSGKTTELIRRIQRYHLANYRCLIVKHSSDHKYSSNATVVSHDGHSLPAVLTTNLLYLASMMKNFDVIGIDDSHKFIDVLEFCQQESESDRTVIVAGLDSCEKNPYPHILNIIPLSESVAKLTAICMSCADEATFTKVIPNEKGETYTTLCGNCYELENHLWRSPFKNYILPNQHMKKNHDFKRSLNSF